MKNLIKKINSVYPSFKSVKKWVYKEDCSDIPFYIIYPITILVLTLYFIDLQVQRKNILQQNIKRLLRRGFFGIRLNITKDKY